MRNFTLNLVVLAVFLLNLSGILWAKEKPFQPKFGIVDFRLLVLAHPLILKFDPQIKRFKDTCSDFVYDKARTRVELEEKAKQTLKKVEELDKITKPILQKGGAMAKEVYSLYWRKRKYLQSEFEIYKKALETVAVDGNYHEGRTFESTVLPVVEEITKFVRDVVEDLKKKYNLLSILDVSVFGEKIPDGEETPFVIPSNLHWEIWKGSPVSSADFAKWKNSLPLSGERTVPNFPVFPIRGGALDLRKEAVELLQSYCNPKF